MDELIRQLESTFNAVAATAIEGAPTIVNVGKAQLLTVLRFLKDGGFNHLALVSCVDWIEEQEFELVHVLTRYRPDNEEHTYQDTLHLIIKTRIPRQSPRLETVTSLFANAEPYEREIHELFGVKFDGHERLTPLFLERDYQIPPFRKDFDTRKYVEETFGNIPSVEDDK